MTSNHKSDPVRNDKTHFIWLTALLLIILVGGFIQSQSVQTLNKLSSELNTLESEHAKLLLNLEEANLIIKNFNLATSAKSESEKELYEQIRGLAADLNQLQISQQNINSELGNRTTQLNDQNKKIADLRTDISAKAAELKLQESLVRSLQSELSNNTPSTLLSVDNYRAAREQLALRQTELNDFDQVVQELDDRLKAEDEAIQQLFDKISASIPMEEFSNPLINGSLLLRFPESVLFEPGSARVHETGADLLLDVAEALKLFPNHNVSVQSHSDSSPITSSLKAKYDSNWELSAARASNVVKQLIDHGSTDIRMQAVGFASTRPLVPEIDDSNRVENRRIEIVLIPI